MEAFGLAAPSTQNRWVSILEWMDGWMDGLEELFMSFA